MRKLFIGLLIAGGIIVFLLFSIIISAIIFGSQEDNVKQKELTEQNDDSMQSEFNDLEELQEGKESIEIMTAKLNHVLDKQNKYANDWFMVELVNRERSYVEINGDVINVHITFNEMIEKEMSDSTMKSWTEGTVQDWKEIIGELYPDYKVTVEYFTHWE